MGNVETGGYSTFEFYRDTIGRCILRGRRPCHLRSVVLAAAENTCVSCVEKGARVFSAGTLLRYVTYVASCDFFK